MHYRAFTFGFAQAIASLDMSSKQTVESMVTRLILVRHGESAVQVSHVVGGPLGCKGLSELGRQQVEALRDRWNKSGIDVDVLISSTLPRALETAEILRPALGGRGVVVDDEVHELYPGACDGITWDDYREQYNVDPRADPYTPLSPGGESFAEFFVRVGRALHRLAISHVGKTVVIACHGGVIDASIATFLGLPTQRGSTYGLHTANASVTEWRASVAPGQAVHWSLVRYNDAAHLDYLT